jgi:hypothetical protein
MSVPLCARSGKEHLIFHYNCILVAMGPVEDRHAIEVKWAQEYHLVAQVNTIYKVRVIPEALNVCEGIVFVIKDTWICD